MKLFFLFYSIIFSFLPTNIHSQPGNERLKAVYVYNFTKLINWASECSNGDFIIGVIGNNPIEKTLGQIAKKKKVGNQEIRIEQIKDLINLRKYHIIFVPYEESNKIGTLMDKIDNECTLIVTEKRGLAQKGSAINFFVKAGKLIFEINLIVFKKHRLQPAESLIKLAENVY